MPSLLQRLNNGFANIKSANPGIAPFVGINDARYRSFMGINSLESLGDTAIARIEIAKRAVWVYACVISRSSVIRDIPLKLYRKNDSGVKVEVEDHPIVKLLQDVNPIKDTPATIRVATEQSLCIHGAYIWKKVRNDAGIVKELYGLPMQYVKTEENIVWVEKFIYEIPTKRGRVTETYYPDDVVYFSYHDFDDSAQGQAPLSTALHSAQADIGVLESQRGMLRNSGRPSVVITTPNKMNDVDYARENERVMANFAGPGNAGKIWLIDNAADTKIATVQLSPAELQWIEQHGSHIKDICASFAVTPGMVGEFADASRLANAGAMHRFYGETFVKPELYFFEQTLNWQLLWKEDWGHGVGWEREHGFFLEHDLGNVSLFREDEGQRSKRAEMAFKSGARVDEVREMNGFNPLGGKEGATIFVPGNLVPLEMSVNQTQKKEGAKPKEDESGRADSGNAQTGSKFTSASESADMEYAKAFRKEKERKRFKKWVKKHNLKSESFKFDHLDSEEQEELLDEIHPARESRELDNEIKSTLDLVRGLISAQLPQLSPNVTVNFPQMNIPVTNNIPVPSVEIKNDQPTPYVSVNVNPTPVNVTNTVETPEVTVNVSPTPVNIENNIDSTPVNIENNIPSPVINVKNDNTVNVPAQVVKMSISPRTEVVERDEHGRIKKIRQEHDIEES